MRIYIYIYGVIMLIIMMFIFNKMRVMKLKYIDDENEDVHMITMMRMTTYILL